MQVVFCPIELITQPLLVLGSAYIYMGVSSRGDLLLHRIKVLLYDVYQRRLEILLLINAVEGGNMSCGVGEPVAWFTHHRMDQVVWFTHHKR